MCMYLHSDYRDKCVVVDVETLLLPFLELSGEQIQKLEQEQPPWNFRLLWTESHEEMSP